MDCFSSEDAAFAARVPHQPTSPEEALARETQIRKLRFFRAWVHLLYSPLRGVFGQNPVQVPRA